MTIQRKEKNVLTILNGDGEEFAKVNGGIDGLKKYCKHFSDPAKMIDISNIQGGLILLSILFKSGNSIQVEFAFGIHVLKLWLYNAEILHGADFLVNGEEAGKLNQDNKFFESNQ